jgi:hypothetical protein
MNAPYQNWKERARARLNPIEPECEPTYTLDRQIDRARSDIGDERWRELMAEWERRT